MTFDKAIEMMRDGHRVIVNDWIDDFSLIMIKEKVYLINTMDNEFKEYKFKLKEIEATNWSVVDDIHRCD